jgi:hypothetical protein
VFSENNLFSAASYFFGFFSLWYVYNIKISSRKDVRKFTRGFEYFWLISLCEPMLRPAFNSVLNGENFKEDIAEKVGISVEMLGFGEVSSSNSC